MKKYYPLLVCILFVFVTNSAWANNLSSHLQGLETEFKSHIRQQPVETFISSDAVLKVVNHSHTVIDMTVFHLNQVEAVKNRLIQLGLTDISVYKKQISGLFPIHRLSELQTISEISWVRSSKAITRVGPPGGAAFNAADPAMFTDVVKKRYNVDGSGIAIGVLSDSYDCLGGAKEDMASGDLPDDVEVLKEYPFCADGASDEGRAMMQLIHDVAPGAKLMFYTAFVSATDFALGIRKLAEAGATIIVDDVGYLDMPMFQDGPIAQSVNEVKAQGVSYFSSAGNRARASYAQTFTSGREIVSFDMAHDFGSAAGESPGFYQKITIPQAALVTITLQWDDPAEVAGGAVAQSDLDFFMLDFSQSRIITSSQDSNIGHNPVERFSYFNDTDITTFFLYISHRAGPAPTHIKYVLNRGQLAPWPIAGSGLTQLTVNTVGALPVLTFRNGSPIVNGTGVIIVPQRTVNTASRPPVIVTIGTGGEDILVDLEDTPFIVYDNIAFQVGDGGLPIWFVPDGFKAILSQDGTIQILREEARIVPVSIDQYATYSSTLYGHPNAAGAIAVGAMPYRETPWFGRPIDQARIEFFSSAGGTQTFFDVEGIRLPTPEQRLKPNIVAPDDVDTTFFPGGDLDDTDSDGSGFPNFSGTSAAAPHAAALAALVLDAFPFLIPDHVALALSRGSLDLHDPAEFTEAEPPTNDACTQNTQFDFGTGCGLVQADRVFDVIIEAINSVFVSGRTSSINVTPGSEFTYFFDIKNASDNPLTNVRLRGIALPERVTYQEIQGCLSIDQIEVSCKIPDLNPDDTWTVTIPVVTSGNPPEQLRFEVDILTDTAVDLSQTHRTLINKVVFLEGDFNADGCVDQTDWGILFGVFRSGGAGTGSEYDLTDDGLVTLADLTALEALYSNPGGASCF